MGARFVQAEDLGPDLRLWSGRAALLALGHRLRQTRADGPEVTFAGSGDFHHLTPMLLRRAMRIAGEVKVTVVHFDHRIDWMKFEDGMHCRSWVVEAARAPGVARLITVGACHRDVDPPWFAGADVGLIEERRLEIYPCTPAPSVRGQPATSLQALGEQGFTDLVLSRIRTEAVYVTLDKAVLRSSEAVGNWGQGCLTLDLVEGLIEAIGRTRNLIGADVVGDWSTPAFGHGLTAMIKRGEAMLDQPCRPADIAAVRRLNETTNRRLLSLFSRVESKVVAPAGEP